MLKYEGENQGKAHLPFRRLLSPKPAEATTTRSKKVVAVEDNPELNVVGKNNKRKEKLEYLREKSKKKIRIKTLANKRKEEYVIDIHVLSDNDPGCARYLPGQE